jgi:hypothetical protein
MIYIDDLRITYNRIEDVGGVGIATKPSCVMFRETMDPNAANVSVVVLPGRQVGMQWRAGTGSRTYRSGEVGDTTNIKWIKREHSGDTFTGSHSIDGENWTVIDTQTIVLNPDMEVGIGVTS